MHAPRCLAALAAIVLLPLTGCVVVPVPRSGRTETAKWEERGRQLLAAGAARREIEGELGPPHLNFTDLKVVGYTWSGGEWGFLWITYGAGEYAKPVTRRVLWLQFDDDNRLVRSGVRRRVKNRSDREQAVAWIRSARTPTARSSDSRRPAASP